MTALTSNPYLLVTGLALVIAGVVARRLAGRWDLGGLALDMAWRSLWERRIDREHELPKRLLDVGQAGGNVSRARMVAGHGARHLVAQALSLAGLVAIVAGLALMGLALILS